MPDSVSVTSHHSYGSRIGNSLKAILGGFILLIISIVLLVRNENNYVKEKASLNEGASIVQEASSTEIDSSLEGKLIHLNGSTASSAEALKDGTFGITTDDLKLKRTVEMYQWYEEEHEECHDNYGGSEDCSTTYTYNTDWSEDSINSNNFYQTANHENPSFWEYKSEELVKEPITLGAYTLTTTFVGKLDNYTTIDLTQQNITNPKAQSQSDSHISGAVDDSIEANNDSYLYGDTQASNDNLFHIQDNHIYIGKDPTKPTVGDLKITFSSVKPGTVSIIGKQLGNELSSYTTSNGRSIALLEQQNVSAEDMFQHAQQANKMLTWIIRFVGLLLMFCAFSAMMQFIETLAKVLPFLANILGVGTRLIAFCLTLVVGFVVIGLAWITVRPIVGISCLVIAAAGIFLLAKSKKSKKDSSPNPVQGPETSNPESTEVIEV